MKTAFSLLIISAILNLSCTALVAHAADPVAPAAPPQAQPAKPDSETRTPKKTKKPGKAKRTRDREAEGTEAPDRFEADTVIKSQYQLNGEYLEVDPD
ncbi:MAG TPA: hypothetical protein VJB59_09225 [Bdellovibrionota bacterium]|nr:hypothetical protein [Bdellovibrionota bacterium]